MSLFSRLTEKSWEGPSADAVDPASYRPPAARVGVIVYFGVTTVLFGLVSSAYVMRMGMPGMGHDAMRRLAPDARAAAAVDQQLRAAAQQPRLGSGARRRAPGTRGPDAPLPCSAPACSASCSSPGSCCCGAQFVQAGYYASSNPANAFFYLITALHGLHLAGGLFFWVRAVLAADERAPTSRLPVELCAVYWHFLSAGLGADAGAADFHLSERE